MANGLRSRTDEEDSDNEISCNGMRQKRKADREERPMKFKAKTRDCQLLVKVKTSFGESIDSKELDRFSRIYLRGFLKPKLVKRNLIEYTGPVGVSLYERFKKPITKRDFLFILEQIVVATQKLQANNFAINRLIMDLQNVYINEITKEVQFLYVPAVNGIQNMNQMEFLETIAYSVKTADEKDNEYVSRFIYFFRAIKPFDINKIEAFVAKEDRSVINTIKKQNAGQSGFMTNKQQHYYEHYDNQEDTSDEEATGLISQDEDATGLLSDEQDEATALLFNDEDEATGILVENQDDEVTGLLNERYSGAHYPTLFRILTEEHISINKPVFRLGKEKSYVDYFVTNNIAVSRSHADIITRNDHYFVKDLNSKNHTYINDEELPVHHEVEIHDGDLLKLGNEEFVFNI